MKILLPLFLFLAAVMTHAKSVTVQNHPELKGRWVLSGIDCADHKLGSLAMSSRQALEEKTSTQGFVIDAGGIQYYMEEGQLGKATCRTTYSENWDIDNGVLKHTGIKFVSRKASGNYKCYEPFKTDVVQRDYTSGIKIQGDVMVLTQPNLQIKNAKGEIEQNCKNGTDILLTYKKVPGS